MTQNVFAWGRQEIMERGMTTAARINQTLKVILPNRKVQEVLWNKWLLMYAYDAQ